MKFHKELIKSLFPQKVIDFSLSTNDLERAVNSSITEVRAQLFSSPMC